jgi:hypothetical protein
MSGLHVSTRKSPPGEGVTRGAAGFSERTLVIKKLLYVVHVEDRIGIFTSPFELIVISLQGCLDFLLRCY